MTIMNVMEWDIVFVVPSQYFEGRILFGIGTLLSFYIHIYIYIWFCLLLKMSFQHTHTHIYMMSCHLEVVYLFIILLYFLKISKTSFQEKEKDSFIISFWL